MDYATRVEEQIAQFAERESMQGLPRIYGYWSQKYVRPALEEVFGTGNVYKIYGQQFLEAAERTGNRSILSIGSGDCNHEVEVAKVLVAEQPDRNFKIVCTELSDIRLDRGRELAREQGVDDVLEFLVADLNEATIDEQFALIFAQHTLHHVVELEQLFEFVDRQLVDDGCFATIDMIGRNGHMRWPETLRWIEQIWASMPEHYKWNHQFKAQHDEFLNWDCSVSGFEGIRAQDILPLLVDRFEFTHFHVCGGLTDVFTERGYGHNIDPDNPIDCEFIDVVHQLNEWLLNTGQIRPTMLFAAMRKRSDRRQVQLSTLRGRQPKDFVRVVNL